MKVKHFGILLSVALVVAVFVGIDWSEFYSYLKMIRLGWIPVFIALCVATNVVRAVRWQYLLPVDDVVDLRKRFDAVWLGLLGTFLLPFRAGEVIRPFIFSRWSQVSFSGGLASIVTERVYDVCAVLIILVSAMWHMTELPSLVYWGVEALAVVTAVILLLMVASYLFGQRVERFLSRLLERLLRPVLPQLLPSLLGMLREFLKGLSAVKTFRSLVGVLFWTITMWVLIVATYYVGVLMLGEAVSVSMAMSVTSLIALAIAAPSAPGFVGTYQVGCIVALTSLYGLSKEFAVAYSLVTHVLQFVTIVAVGLVILNLRAMRFQDLSIKSAGRECA